jgi:hypothetical protein
VPASAVRHQRDGTPRSGLPDGVRTLPSTSRARGSGFFSLIDLRGVNTCPTCHLAAPGPQRRCFSPCLGSQNGVANCTTDGRHATRTTAPVGVVSTLTRVNVPNDRLRGIRTESDHGRRPRPGTDAECLYGLIGDLGATPSDRSRPQVSRERGLGRQFTAGHRTQRAAASGHLPVDLCGGVAKFAAGSDQSPRRWPGGR